MLNKISTSFSDADMGRKEGKHEPEGPLFIDKISGGHVK
jgi:hypothetical protein